MKPLMEDPVRWNLFLPKQLLWRLRKTAFRREMRTAELVRQACEAYLKALDKKDAEQRAQTKP